MKNNILKFNLPPEMVTTLNRYYQGNQEISNDKRAKGWFIIQKLNDEYKKCSKKLDYLLDVEWDKEKIEEHYCDIVFRNAHRRLKRYENKLYKIHKAMFALLTNFDKINSPFIKGEVISAEEIYQDFKSKYVDKVKSGFKE